MRPAAATARPPPPARTTPSTRTRPRRSAGPATSSSYSEAVPVDGIEEHLRPGWVVCTARVSGDTAATPRARVLDRIQVFHGDVPRRFEVRYDWFDPSKK